MSPITPFSTVNCNCSQAARSIRADLSLAGLQAIQTFDLKSARLAPSDCTCPHHGEKGCDCDMTVLLVYGNLAEPATLVLHGKDGSTWISFAENAVHPPDSHLRTQIKRIVRKIMRNRSIIVG